MKFRFGLRSKLLLLASFLFFIPWFGYQYVWEMEKYLRFGQEQTIIGTARALATALHDRPNLFNNQASFLPNVEQGKDLYAYKLKQAIKLDGVENDWPNFSKRSHYYGVDNQLPNPTESPHQAKSNSILSQHFTAALGKYDKFLYFFLRVVDDHVVMRADNARSIINNDHLEISFTQADGRFSRFIISNKNTGWLESYQINSSANVLPVPSNTIQGHWQSTSEGFNIEFRLPLDAVSDNIAFALHDVDEKFGQTLSVIGSADPSQAETLGTIVVPSPEIERIVQGMSYTHSRIWVVDQHKRVLASTGNIQTANGLWQKNQRNNQLNNTSENSFISYIEQNWLKPIYDLLLTKPPKAFIDQLYDNQQLTGKHIESALTGIEKSQWRLTTDQQAVILSAAYPIFLANTISGSKVKGAVIVEETTNGIRSVRNQALEKLFSSILAIMAIGSLAFFFFASRIASRIRTLRNQAEQSIDEHGRITHMMPASNTNDEIGDLSRSFSTAVSRLSQYNHYLENMSSRLSHELRTPIAVVRTSLENLSLQDLSSNANVSDNGNKNVNLYIERAYSGIERLNLILTNMSEATQLEQMLTTTEKIPFNLFEVLGGCINGYQQIYPDFIFEYCEQLHHEQLPLLGSPDHIAQLLDKVFTNAAQFSQDKKIVISYQITKNSLLLHISNNGELLPEQMAERIFDSMVSVRKNKKDENPHLGLGLYISRLICQFHQGNISASDHHNPQGVTITITLPLTTDG
jgi:dedicated sortase system histidine kinase